MPKKSWMLAALAVVLAAGYIIGCTNWLRPAAVQVYHTYREPRSRSRPLEGMPGLIFVLDRPLRLTGIEVVSLAEFQTNRHTLPVWDLVSDSNSVPVKSFFYGQSIRGLKPAVPGSHAQPLATHVVYRLRLKAGKIRGEHDFELK